MFQGPLAERSTTAAIVTALKAGLPGAATPSEAAARLSRLDDTHPLSSWRTHEAFPAAWTAYLQELSRDGAAVHFAPVDTLSRVAAALLGDVDRVIDVNPQDGVFAAFLQHVKAHQRVDVQSGDRHLDTVLRYASPTRPADIQSGKIGVCAEVWPYTTSRIPTPSQTEHQHKTVSSVARRIADGDIHRAVLFLPTAYLGRKYKGVQHRRELLKLAVVSAAGTVTVSTPTRRFELAVIVLESGQTAPKGLDVNVGPNADIETAVTFAQTAAAHLTDPTTTFNPIKPPAQAHFDKSASQVRELMGELANLTLGEVFSTLVDTGPRVPLRDVLTSFRTGEWGTAPHPGVDPCHVIGNSDISRGTLNPVARTLTAEMQLKARINPGDLVMATSVQPGRTLLITQEGLFASNFLRVLRVDPTKILPEFLAVYLSSSEAAVVASHHSSRSTMKNLHISYFDHPIPVPDLATQQEIVDAARLAAEVLPSRLGNLTLNVVSVDVERAVKQTARNVVGEARSVRAG